MPVAELLLFRVSRERLRLWRERLKLGSDRDTARWRAVPRPGPARGAKRTKCPSAGATQLRAEHYPFNGGPACHMPVRAVLPELGCESDRARRDPGDRRTSMLKSGDNQVERAGLPEEVFGWLLEIQEASTFMLKSGSKAAGEEAVAGPQP